MSDVDQEISKRLRKARKLCRDRKYKSARSFANEHGIPESTYSQHETGKRSLSPKTLLYYCDCLGIDPGWLVSGREPMKQFSSDANAAAAVAEVSLRTSNRQVSSKDSDTIMDDFIVMNMDIFKGVLKKAIQEVLNIAISDEKLEALIELCEPAYNVTKRSSDFPMKDSDTIEAA